MSKHRRATTPAQAPPPRPVREVLIWTCFGCALVPLVLLWSGVGWEVAVGVGGLIALLALGCAAVLRLSGMSLSPVDRADDDPGDGGRRP